MRPPPQKPSILKEHFDVIPGYERYKDYGLAERFFDRTRSDVVAYSGKSPNPTLPAAKPVGWLPPKLYLRFGAEYNPSGIIYGEQIYMGSLEWSIRTIPLGVLPSTTYLGAAINAPFTKEGYHPWLSSNQETRLITECLIKVQSRKADYGEAIGESLQTVNHMSNTVKRLCWIVLGLKRKDPKLLLKGLSLKPTTRNIVRHRRKMNRPGKKYIAMALGTGGKRYDGLVSASWLEYQYAWLPLMSDIKDTYDLLNKGFGDRPQLIRAVRKLEDNSEVDFVAGPTKATGTLRVTDRCILFYTVSNADLAKYGQVGLINPLEVAWALVPYSFVIDWLVPVGNLFQALSASVGLTYRGGCLSRLAEGSRSLEVLTPTSRRPYKKEKSSYRCKSVHKSFERKPIVGSPMPGLYIKSPFSTKHATSALALMAQLSRR